MRSRAFLIRRCTADRARSAATPARPLGPGGVAGGLGVGLLLAQLLQALPVAVARFLIEQLARVAGVALLDPLAAPGQLQHVHLAVGLPDQVGEVAQPQAVLEAEALP